MNNLFRRSVAPVVTCLLHQTFTKQTTRCDDNPNVQKLNVVVKDESLQAKEGAKISHVVVEEEKKKLEDEGKESKKGKVENVNEEEKEEEPLFHNLFPLRQLWRPKLEYPLWDENWDGRKIATTGDDKKDREMKRYVRKNGITRHIILIRHGQYDETSKVRG